MPLPEHIDPRWPSIEHLRERARRRVPRFAFEYLEGGCHAELNLARNTAELREIRLRPDYLSEFEGASLQTEVFGRAWSAPFGVAPVGLQGLMWPGATEMLAAAAHAADIPFVLSTVATADIETVADLTERTAWFQLYHPREDELRDALLDRAEAAGVEVLVLLADTPTFGYRPKEIRNGLSIPPRMTARNVLQMCTRPTWSLGQLRTGAPTFRTMKPYLPSGLDLKHLGEFMNRTFEGRLTTKKVEALRARWRGKLVVKGIVTVHDAERALGSGADALIVSNHGGRQHDVGQSTVRSLLELRERLGDGPRLFLDSGARTGADVACALGAGADFVFLGRSFMYGVCAMGMRGGSHTIAMIGRQLRQVLEQVGCTSPAELRERRYPS